MSDAAAHELAQALIILGWLMVVGLCTIALSVSTIAKRMRENRR